MSKHLDYLEAYINANKEDPYAREALYHARQELNDALQEAQNELGRRELAVQIGESGEQRYTRLESCVDELVEAANNIDEYLNANDGLNLVGSKSILHNGLSEAIAAIKELRENK